jgi:hypothetical protein
MCKEPETPIVETSPFANLDNFLIAYGEELGRVAETALQPLHVPGRDPATLQTWGRHPFPGQAECIVAGVKKLKRDKALLIVAEMGTGKTLMGMLIVAEHARHLGGYRAVVMCPGTLVKKWQREIKETIPGARARILDSFEDLVPIAMNRPRAEGAEWLIVGRDRAKLSCGWTWVANRRRGRPGFYCPDCGQVLLDDDGVHREEKWLDAERQHCDNLVEDSQGIRKDETEARTRVCGARLWQEIRDPDRFGPARYVKLKMRGLIDYFIVDEAHEEKSEDSVQALAMGWLAGSARKVIALTGTLVGGYAWHVRTLLFRMGAAKGLVDMGLGWKERHAFDHTYGRIETTITETDRDNGNGGDGYRQSRGSKNKSVREKVKPGIMPTLFGEQLVGCSIFLSLDEVSADLPPLQEDVVPVDLGPLATDYERVQDALADAIKDMVRIGDKRLLATMLQTLLCYPDYPFGWGDVGYFDKKSDRFVAVVKPRNMDPTVIYPKERALLDQVARERKDGRKCWIYTTFVGERDCAQRLEQIIKKELKLQVKVMRATVDPARREEWIAKHGPHHDVIISHPELVKTGLDFFDKAGSYNFPTLLFYQTGYNLFTMMQAARRAWRIGQKWPCRVLYFYYEASMQARAMALMGQKAAAANAVSGRFSSEGLTAMAGEDEGMEMAMARQLAEKTAGKGEALRAWSKITTSIAYQQMTQEGHRAVQSLFDLVGEDDFDFDDLVESGVGS